jgi:RNA polymerase-binding transcription factor DksA
MADEAKKQGEGKGKDAGSVYQQCEHCGKEIPGLPLIEGSAKVLWAIECLDCATRMEYHSTKKRRT